MSWDDFFLRLYYDVRDEDEVMLYEKKWSILIANCCTCQVLLGDVFLFSGSNFTTVTFWQGQKRSSDLSGDDNFRPKAKLF